MSMAKQWREEMAQQASMSLHGVMWPPITRIASNGVCLNSGISLQQCGSVSIIAEEACQYQQHVWRNAMGSVSGGK